jgi:hypothetical protein
MKEGTDVGEDKHFLGHVSLTLRVGPRSRSQYQRRSIDLLCFLRTVLWAKPIVHSLSQKIGVGG